MYKLDDCQVTEILKMGHVINVIEAFDQSGRKIENILPVFERRLQSVMGAHNIATRGEAIDRVLQYDPNFNQYPQSPIPF